MKKQSWKISRKTLLKGMGASLALPLLDVMGDDALIKEAKIKRLCYVFFGNGVAIPSEKHKCYKDWHWWPHQTGKDYTFTKCIKPFEPLRNKMSIFGGLWHPNYSGINIHGDAFMWMTGNNVGDVNGNKYTADQIFADTYGQETRFPSLSLSSDGGVGMIDNTTTLSAGVSGRPIPSMNDPRMIFKRLFKSSKDNKEMQRKSNLYEAKLVDMVMQNAKTMNKSISKNDQHKMDQYMTSLSEIEGTIQRNFKWIDQPRKNINSDNIKTDVDQSLEPDQYFTTMFDLMALAFEADLTRCITFAMTMSGANGIANKFPSILFKGSLDHHNLSHAMKKPEQAVNMGRYDNFLSSKMANFLKKLDKTPQGNNTQLDNTAVLYGSANSWNHNWKNLPLILAGGSNLGFKHGSHTKYDGKTPMNNLHLTMLHSMGIKNTKYGDSTGIMKELFV
jgi:hypothetical protein